MQKNNFQDNFIEFSKLPYKEGLFASRAWGHPLHFLLSYPSKLKPSIAHYLVKLFSDKGDKILDPFSGSGTIPFEATFQGRIGVGNDINPLAFHTTRAKVNGISLKKIEKQVKELENFIEENKTKSFKVEKEIIAFYHKNTLQEILTAKEFFLQNKKKDYSFLIASVAHILHGNRPYALSRRSHNIIPWKPDGPTIYKNLIEHLQAKIHRMKKVELPKEFVKGKSYQKNTSNLPFENQTIDHIMTSPPFIQNRDFLRMNRIRLWFCGWDYEYQNKMKIKFLENISNIDVYSEILKEYHRILKPGSNCILHLGVVKNINMAEELKIKGNKIGFKFKGIINEDSTKLESHGIRDRGATHTHQFLFLKK